MSNRKSGGHTTESSSPPERVCALLRQPREAWYETKLVHNGKRVGQDCVLEDFAVPNGVDMNRIKFDASPKLESKFSKRPTAAAPRKRWPKICADCRALIAMKSE